MKKILILSLCLVVLVSGCISITDDNEKQDDQPRPEKEALNNIINLTEDECEYPECMSPEEYESQNISKR